MTLAEYINSQFSVIQYVDFFARMVVACLCGACIGVERSKRLKEAGIRTHIIVCCAASLMMIISKYGFADLTNPEGVAFNGTRGADPARIAAQVVSGISFLGAGVIFKNGSTIKGLTTAAGIWATAGIGLAIGSGMYIVGVFATVVIALLQIVMHKFTLGADSLVTNQLKFTIRDSDAFREKFVAYLRTNQVQIVESEIVRGEDGYATYDLLMKSAREITLQELNALMDSNQEMQSIHCTHVG